MSALPKGVVLHVDNERPVRESLSLLLRTEHYTVMSAASGAEALALVAQGPRPDVLIVDCDIDQSMNGTQLLHAYRRFAGYGLPAIMLTGSPDHAGPPGAADAPVWLVRKPVDPRLLLAVLPGFVQLSRAMRPLREGPPARE